MHAFDSSRKKKSAAAYAGGSAPVRSKGLVSCGRGRLLDRKWKVALPTSMFIEPVAT